MPELSSLLGFAALVSWGFMAVGHGMFWRPLLPVGTDDPAVFPSVDIIVPARNEAQCLAECLSSLLMQDYPGIWKIILVDDHSTDGTSAIARAISDDLERQGRLWIAAAPDLAEGWSGKVAAMNVGVGRSEADMILFTDADIRHAPQSLRHLVARAENSRLDLVSRMVKLNCASFAEKLLIPAFVFFFAMLYPFRRSNNPRSEVAAAAGGTMLIRRAMLDQMGGLECIKSALIDDCSLAKAVKEAGGRIELSLTTEINSVRPYPFIADVWQMVARTAYTQLRYNFLLLLCTLIGMGLLYLTPPVLFIFASTPAPLFMGLLAWAIMTMLYLPMIRFYGLNSAWALALPLAGLIYGLATLDSARLYYQGKGGLWKGRAQVLREKHDT